MKPVIKIFLYLMTSLLVGVLLAPWFYKLVQLVPAKGEGILAHAVALLQQMPFHRYVSRSIQVVALLLLWPTVRSLHLHRLSDLSLYPNAQPFLDCVWGLGAALLPIGLLHLFFLWQGWYLFYSTILWGSFFRLVGTACVVSLFEEFFFRGLLLGLCRRFLKGKANAIFTALLFASIHFLNLPHAGENNVHWWSGFDLLRTWTTALPLWPLALGAFGSLFLIGVILAWVTLKTYSLWLAIGLHAGWIFGEQFFNLIAHDGISSSDSLFPWLGPSQIYGMVPIGLLFLIPMGITILLLDAFLARRRALIPK
ncbi:MAG: CPBP family intramembrane metalloprotease [Chthoniobacterales bacterium]|nr:CPBP family intramembrane metalloprotease [Chthoniobacterales bacterium]